MQDEREHLVTSFKGKLERMGESFKGNLYLTNLRLGGTGTLKQISLNKKLIIGGWLLAGLVGATLMSFSTLDDKEKSKSIKWAIKRELTNTFSDEELGKFKHNFPIIKAYDIEKSKDNIIYFIKLSYEHQIGLKAIGFKLTPLKEKNEKKNDFNIRRTEVLNRIEETLIKTQSLDDYESAKKPIKLFLIRISKEIDDSGKEVINRICAHCKEQNKFKELDGNIFQCLKCGADHYIRE